MSVAFTDGAVWREGIRSRLRLRTSPMLLPLAVGSGIEFARKILLSTHLCSPDPGPTRRRKVRMGRMDPG